MARQLLSDDVATWQSRSAEMSTDSKSYVRSASRNAARACRVSTSRPKEVTRLPRPLIHLAIGAVLFVLYLIGGALGLWPLVH